MIFQRKKHSTLAPNRKRGPLFSFENRMLAFFLLLVAFVAFILLFSGKVGEASRQNRKKVALVEYTLAYTDSILSLQKDIELQTRGFLITGDTAFLETNAEKDASIRKAIETLSGLTPGNPRQQSRIDTLQHLVLAHRAARERQSALRRAGRLSRRQEIETLLASQENLTRQQSLISLIKTEEGDLLARRKKAYTVSVQEAVVLINMLLVLFIVFMLAGFLVIYITTKKRKRAEAALLNSEALVRSIIHHAPVLVNVKDLAGRYLLANQQSAAAMGTTPEAMLGKTAFDLLPPENARSITRMDSDVAAGRALMEMEMVFPAADGPHTYITSKFPLFDSSGKLYGVGATAVDITPLNKAHKALADSYQEQQHLLNGLQQALGAASDVICIFNEAGAFVKVSSTVAGLIGYTPEALAGRNFMDFVAEEDRPRALVGFSRLMAGEAVSEFACQYRKKDGGLVPVIWSGKRLSDDGFLYCIARDGSALVHNTRALAQSRQQLADAQQIARLGNWDWNLEQNTWSCSAVLLELLGAAPSRQGDLYGLLLEVLHPDDRASFGALRKYILKQGTIDFEHRIVRGDRSIAYMHTRGVVRRNALGKAVQISGTMQDITQRKQHELELESLNGALAHKAAQLEASNRELERFAYVASHDLQEPLRMVSSFLNLLHQKLEGALDETSGKYIHFALDGAARMKSLIRDLLHYSRTGNAGEDFGTVDLNRVLEEVLQVFEPALAQAGAQVRAGRLPLVSGSATQLRRLLQNLVGNALKYKSERPPLIEIGVEAADGGPRFYVRDNGIGIDPRFYDKIFVLFQRLHPKNEYGGTGIGLALCQKIVAQHGGTIWVTSTPGEGSTFYFTLKRAEHA